MSLPAPSRSDCMDALLKGVSWVRRGHNDHLIHSEEDQGHCIKGVEQHLASEVQCRDAET